MRSHNRLATKLKLNELSAINSLRNSIALSMLYVYSRCDFDETDGHLGLFQADNSVNFVFWLNLNKNLNAEYGQESPQLTYCLCPTHIFHFYLVRPVCISSLFRRFYFVDSLPISGHLFFYNSSFVRQWLKWLWFIVINI